MLTIKSRRGMFAAAICFGLVVAVMFFALTYRGRSVQYRVGFYSPGGIPGAVVRRTNVGVFNAVTPRQVEANLRQLDQTHFAATIDLGQVITRVVDPSLVRTTYHAMDGKAREKIFPPKVDGNVREFIPDAELQAILGPLLEVMARHSAHVDTVLLVDEPYLNGISKAELERVGAIVRTGLDAGGLRKVKLGVVFASAMFDRDFARMVDAEAGAYVASIDNVVRNGSPVQADFREWVDRVRTHRLATYDRAGNMYLGGGLPRGFESIGFDFYLSTLLVDGLYEDSLSWLASRYPSECGQFSDQRVSALRRTLSFFQAGPVVQDAAVRAKDRKVLDGIYRCRMGATTIMLKRAAEGRHLDFVLVSESSSNGVWEFDPAGNLEQVQPPLLVESRVLDEVERAQQFYLANQCFYSAGLLYFTFADAYDSMIKLNVGGVASMPSVKGSIFRFASARDGESIECGLSDYWSKIAEAKQLVEGIGGARQE